MVPVNEALDHSRRLLAAWTLRYAIDSVLDYPWLANGLLKPRWYASRTNDNKHAAAPSIINESLTTADAAAVETDVSSYYTYVRASLKVF